MPAINVLANVFTTIDNTESRRKNECIIMPTSKLSAVVLNTLKKDGYIEDFEYFDDKRGCKFKVKLHAKISKCGSISPRFKVKKNEYTRWELQYLPSYSRGMLLVTTNEGVMSHHDALNLSLIHI